MADTQEVRRRNLRRLVSEHEGMNNLAHKLGLTKGAYISQLLTDPPVRTISEKTARKWEKALMLPEGWLDGQPKSYTTAPPAALNTSLLAEVITAASEALKAVKVCLPPARFSDLVSMAYTDAIASGHVNTARLDTIVGLLKH
jgi:hypothetical protein